MDDQRLNDGSDIRPIVHIGKWGMMPSEKLIWGLTVNNGKYQKLLGPGAFQELVKQPLSGVVTEITSSLQLLVGIPLETNRLFQKELKYSIWYHRYRTANIYKALQCTTRTKTQKQVHSPLAKHSEEVRSIFLRLPGARLKPISNCAIEEVILFYL